MSQKIWSALAWHKSLYHNRPSKSWRFHPSCAIWDLRKDEIHHLKYDNRVYITELTWNIPDQTLVKDLNPSRCHTNKADNACILQSSRDTSPTQYWPGTWVQQDVIQWSKSALFNCAKLQFRRGLSLAFRDLRHLSGAISHPIPYQKQRTWDIKLT